MKIWLKLTLVAGATFSLPFTGHAGCDQWLQRKLNPQSSLSIALDKLAFGGDEGVHTDALLVLKDSKLVYERYGQNYTVNSKHRSWSMSKSIGGIIMAQAMDQLRLKPSTPLEQVIPEYRGQASLLDLFQMSSGIRFNEEYYGIPVNSDATKMLYLKGPQVGFAEYTASLPPRVDAKPGDHFYYSSGDSNLIMKAIQNTYGWRGMGDEYAQHPWDLFFDRMGIPDATFERDVQNTFVASSYMYMTPVDYLKIGQLIANRGIYEGERIIPLWYYDLMTQVAPGVQKRALPGTSPTRAYSALFSTNLPIEGRGLPSEYPGLPEDAVLMIGYQGQLLISSAKENLVILRLATDKGPVFSSRRNELFSTIQRGLKSADVESFQSVQEAHPDWYANRSLIQSASTLTPRTKVKFGDYFKLPQLLHALFAKEMCSCLFVLKRGFEECRQDLTATLPNLLRAALPNRPTIDVNWRQKIVTTQLIPMIGAKSEALFFGDKLGCVLKPE